MNNQVIVPGKYTSTLAQVVRQPTNHVIVTKSKEQFTEQYQLPIIGGGVFVLIIVILVVTFSLRSRKKHKRVRQ